MIFSVLSSLVIIEPLIIFRKFFTGFFRRTNGYTKCTSSYYVYSLFWTTMQFLWDSGRRIKRYWTFLIPGYCRNYRNLLFSYYLDIYYFRGILPIKCSVLCLSYLMDTNDCSYYDRQKYTHFWRIPFFVYTKSTN